MSSFENIHGPQGYKPAMSRYMKMKTWWKKDLTPPQEHASVASTNQKEEPMTEYKYTVGQYLPDSTALVGAWYNENTKELGVTLRESLNFYVYSDVPKGIYEELVHPSQSAGRVYAREVKPNYGPGDNWGYGDSIYPAQVDVAAPVVTTPKGLSYAEDAVVDGAPLNVVPLRSEAPVGVQYRHQVAFEVEGQTGERTYNVEAGSVTEAVEKLNEVARMLSLTFVVKQVVTYFG